MTIKPFHVGRVTSSGYQYMIVSPMSLFNFGIDREKEKENDRLLIRSSS